MTRQLDPQFTEHRIRAVRASSTSEQPGWLLEFDDGFCLWCTAEQCQQEPKPGETVRLYGKGFGYEVRGIVIGERIYRYLTEAQQQAHHAEWCREQERQRQARLEFERADRDARRAALPEPFRRRLDGFEAARPDWRRDYESYELFVCEEAARLAARFTSVDELLAFEFLAFSQRSHAKAAAPELRFNEHSGNTWGAAIGLATVYLQQPTLLPRCHGAICPLVGCRDCGCHAARGTL